jgi:hypothetical protein
VSHVTPSLVYQCEKHDDEQNKFPFEQHPMDFRPEQQLADYPQFGEKSLKVTNKDVFPILIVLNRPGKPVVYR